MIKDFIKIHRKGFVFGIILLGICIIAISAILIGIKMTKKYSVIGPWSNEALHQQLRFVDGDSMMITTASGINEAKYDFDKNSGEGEISINGKTIQFYRKGASIFLIGENGEAEYSKGELADNVLATVTTAMTTDVTTELTTEMTTESIVETTETVAEPSASSIVAVTATPSPTPLPTTSPTPSPTTMQIYPSLTLGFDPFLPVLGTPIVGKWTGKYDKDQYIVFDDDGTYYAYHNGAFVVASTYTYDPLTGDGVAHTEEFGDYIFDVYEDGNEMYFDYTSIVYERQE